jgi:AAA domain-containing protein/bifunctional DNA primase/polymerase-like protein/primase-like protein
MHDSGRELLLERYGAFYGGQQFAVAWTATNEATGSDDQRAKQVTTHAWQTTKPLPDGSFAAGLFKVRGLKRNPALVLRPSGLIGLECDSEQDLAAIEALGLPATITVCSSAPHKRHYWFRPPAELETLPYVAFRFEHGNVNADGERYLLMPPAIHPSGAVYSFLPGLGLGEVEIAELPAAAYSECVRRWQNGEQTQRERLQVDRDAKVEVGRRHDMVFRFACAMRRWTSSEEEILAAALAYNERHCDPPMSEARVRSQVRGALKMADRPLDDDELDLRRQAEEFEREFLAGAVKPRAPQSTGSKGKQREVARRPLRDVVIERVELIDGTSIPIGTTTNVVGIGGLGKSAYSLAMAKKVTDSGGSVLVITYEDAAGAVIRPRFEALGGDVDKLFVLSVDPADGDVTFPTDLPEIERHAHETGARLLIVDPVSASIDLKLDTHRDQDVRSVLGQMAKLAERERLANLLIGHLNKSPGSDPYLRIGGSGAFFNAARLVLTVTPDPADPEWLRVVTAHKANYGAVPRPERWRVVVKEIESPVGPIDVMTLEFVEIANDMRREDVLAPPPSPEKRSEAEALIMVELARGRRLSAEVKQAGMQAGISKSTVERAARALEVAAEEETTGTGRVTFWSLPDAIAGHVTPYSTAADATPLRPHNQADSGDHVRGSRHPTDVGADATLADCAEHPRAGLWRARDGRWRCRECKPPAFPGEVVEERSR